MSSKALICTHIIRFLLPRGTRHVVQYLVAVITLFLKFHATLVLLVICIKSYSWRNCWMKCVI